MGDDVTSLKENGHLQTEQTCDPIPYDEQTASGFRDVSLAPDDPITSRTEEQDAPSTRSDSDPDEVMYSVGSTPSGTPIRVPNSTVLGEDEKNLLVQMESQNEMLDKIQSLEHLLKIREQEWEDAKQAYEAKVSQLEKELEISKEQSEANLNDVKKNLSQRLEQATKQLNNTRRELESMVMKYAMSEKQILDAKKGKEQAEKQMRDALKDKESLSARVKALSNDKSSLTSALDKKITELAIHQKEVDRLQSELKDRDLKLKQTQQRLQATIDAHDEVKEQLLNLNNVIEVLKRELEHSKHNELEHIVEKPAETEVTSSDHQPDCDRVLHPVSETQASEVVDSSGEREQLQSRLESLTSEKKRLEEKINELSLAVDKWKQEAETYQAQVSELETVTSDLCSVRRENEELREKLETMSNTCRELQEEAELHRHKESEVLELSESLKEKVENCHKQRQQLEIECETWQERAESLSERLNESKSQTEGMREKYESVVSSMRQQITSLEQELSDSKTQIQQLRDRIDEIENDKRIIGKKRIQEVKEMNREISSLRRKIQVLESQSASTTNLSLNPPASDALSATSRTSSSSSIDLAGKSSQEVHHPIRTTTSSDSHSKSDENADDSSPPFDSYTSEVITNLPDLDKGKLVERILKLQKTLAKRSERMDFLEDHNHQLVEELKKKTRLIQYYLLREESGALTTAEMDRNKRELVRKGATTMSSLFNGTSESEMTLELSLEINRKLQAVLEDTLLKNFMLKDSLSTLGDEIARLNGKPPHGQR